MPPIRANSGYLSTAPTCTVRHMHPKRVAQLNASRPRLKNQELDAMIRAAWDAGWWCEVGKKGHVKCFDPGGKKMVIVPSTPSDYRSIPNTRSQFRQAGLAI